MLASSSSPRPISPSTPNNAFPPPYRNPSPFLHEEKYSPPPTPSPLQSRNPFERPYPRLHIPNQSNSNYTAHARERRETQSYTAPRRRSRAKTLARLALLVLVLVCAGSAVKSWGCGGEGCMSRDVWLEKARNMGGESSGYVGGGAVLGGLGWGGKSSAGEREHLMASDNVGQVLGGGQGEGEQQWFVENDDKAEEGEIINGGYNPEQGNDQENTETELLAAEERHENSDSIVLLSPPAEQYDDNNNEDLHEDGDESNEIIITQHAEELAVEQQQQDLETSSPISQAAQDAQDEAFAESLLMEPKLSEQLDAEPEHTHVGDVDPGFREAMMEGHILASMPMEF
ncbi:hypothetical protein J1614_009502 [Plenodomus biglobosus]|nr:hypothetical protein J1614_009502 [Plenodomus biglobosus]